MGQEVSGRLLSAEVQVKPQTGLYGMCGGQSDIGTASPPLTLGFIS